MLWVYTVRQLYIFNSFSVTILRQILTSKIYPRAERAYTFLDRQKYAPSTIKCEAHILDQFMYTRGAIHLMTSYEMNGNHQVSADRAKTRR